MATTLTFGVRAEGKDTILTISEAVQFTWTPRLLNAILVALRDGEEPDFDDLRDEFPDDAEVLTALEGVLSKMSLDSGSLPTRVDVFDAHLGWSLRCTIEEKGGMDYPEIEESNEQARPLVPPEPMVDEDEPH